MFKPSCGHTPSRAWSSDIACRARHHAEQIHPPPNPGRRTSCHRFYNRQCTSFTCFPLTESTASCALHSPTTSFRGSSDLTSKFTLNFRYTPNSFTVTGSLPACSLAALVMAAEPRRRYTIREGDPMNCPKSARLPVCSSLSPRLPNLPNFVVVASRTLLCMSIREVFSPN